VILGINHDDDETLVVIVSLTTEPSAQVCDKFDRLIHVLDGDVEMNTDLPPLRFRDRLEHQTGLSVAPMAEVHPAVLRRAGLATEQSAPKAGHTFWIEAVDGHARPHARHGSTLDISSAPAQRPLYPSSGGSVADGNNP
jgi:hypothetical protein